MRRYDIINHLIKKYKYNTYLEIGVRNGKNFSMINVAHKDGVDPNAKCSYKVTSDEFFNRLGQNILYDIIFIDGLHIKDQVLRDVENSLSHLSDNGTIVMHDCNPLYKDRTTLPITTSHWNGTVWEAFATLRMTRSDLYMCVVDTDHGCGIIRRGRQNTIEHVDLLYETLNDNRKQILNLISINDFIKME